MIHDLKAWPEFFEAVWSGAKTCEWRVDDRGFEVGHHVVLREWEPGPTFDDDGEGRYTGRSCVARITHIIRGGRFGMPDGYAVLSLGDVARDHYLATSDRSGRDHA